MTDNIKISTALKKLGNLWVLSFIFLTTPVLGQPVVSEGFIHLTDHDFNTHEVIPLSGDWGFFWNALLDPEDIAPLENPVFRDFASTWDLDDELSTEGAATYTLTIVLPHSHPPLALDIPDFYSSYRLFINGEEISSNGNPSLDESEYSAYWLPQVKSLVNHDTDTLSLVLHVANFGYSNGGAYLPLGIGKAEQLYRSRTIEYGYSLVLMGALLMAGLFFFGLYFFGRNDQAILYFALFCIVYSYRIVGYSPYPLHYLLPDLPWLLTTKLEYLTLYFAGFFFGTYTLKLYPNETSVLLMNILRGISLLFAAIALILPPSVFSYLVNPYIFIVTGYMVYAFWVYTKAAINKNVGARFAVASTGVVFLVFLNIILVYFGLIQEYLLLSFLGYLFFFGLQSLVLSYRFADSLKTAKEQAEESSQAKSQFLSTMSHEIRTPLNAVIGLSGLLSESELNEKQKEFSQTIKTSGETLLSILNNILDYSKIESEKIELEHKEFDLKKLIQNVIEVNSPSFNDKDIKLSYELGNDVPLQLVGDSTRLQQILLNLVSNAVKFTEKGSVLIKVSSLSKKSNPKLLKFEVSDTGIGIPDDKVNRLFESFSQVDASTTRKYGGTGLGLAISKRLVELMGGTIEVSSKEKEGSTFSFTIQLFEITIKEPPKDTKESDTETQSEGATFEKLSVLVAEDNMINQKVAIRILEQLDIVPDIANNGEEAAEMVSKNKYDLVFMDMEMPVMDGLDATREIRKQKDTLPFNPKIIAMTANALPGYREKCLEAGMDDFITKPVSTDSIRSILATWF
ncbi:MAG: response regulator [Balneola sp.]|nr:MAG: response regulator [Balneola sp.]